MGKILCKIFRFLADVFDKVVEFVASAIKTIGNAVVDVLSELVTVAGDAIGSIFSSNPLLLVGGGLLLWFLLGRKNDEEGATYPKLNVGASNG